MENLKEKTAKAFLWQTTFQTLSQSFSWCITILLVRILEPGDYGLIGMAMIFMGLMDILVDLGLGAAIIQRKESRLTKEDLSSLFWVGILAGVGFYIIIYAVSPSVAAYFEEPRLSGIIRLSGVGFFIGCLRLIPYNLLTKTLQFRKRGMAEFLSWTLSSIFCLIAALSGLGVWSLVIAYALKEAFLTIIIYIYQPFKPQFIFACKSIKNMFNFGIKLTVSRFLWYLYSNADYLIIGRILGKIPLGYYSVAFQLSSMPVTKINQLIREVSFPAYSQIQDNKQELGFYFIKNIELVALILFPILLGLYAVSDDFYAIILGERWLNGVMLFRILCISCLFKAVFSQHAPVLNAVGRPDINFKYNLVLAIIMPISFVIMLKYGILWVAVAWVTVYPILSLYIVYQTLKILSLDAMSYMRAFVVPTISCIIMVLVVGLLQRVVPAMSMFRLIAACATGLIVYALSIWLISDKTISDLKDIVFLLRQRRAF